MKKILFAVAAFFTINLCAQTNTKVAPKPNTQQTDNTKELLLTKAWSLTKTEEFSVESPAEGKQKDDGVTFVADKTLFLTMQGEQKTGTWLLDKTQANVMVTIDGGKEKYRFKILTLTADEFKFEYQDAEYSKIKWTCVPKKK